MGDVGNRPGGGGDTGSVASMQTTDLAASMYQTHMPCNSERPGSRGWGMVDKELRRGDYLAAKRKDGGRPPSKKGKGGPPMSKEQQQKEAMLKTSLLRASASGEHALPEVRGIIVVDLAERNFGMHTHTHRRPVPR